MVKRGMALLLLLGLLLLGCHGMPQGEALASATDLPATATPLPPIATEQLFVEAAPITPSPTVQPTPSPTPTPSPSPTPTPSPTPEPTPFTLVWMTDTQVLSRHYPDVFNSMRDWILENREKENIQFVAHTGDVVDGIGPAMFENAATALVPIFETLPGMVVSGNHDISSNGSQWFFTQRPYAKLVQKAGQTYKDGLAAYVTFRGCDTDFLVFGIGYNEVCTAWMNEVIAKHPDHVVIAIVHRGLQETGAYTRETKAIFNNVMAQNHNFRLILCGHQRGFLQRTEWFDDDGDGEKERSVTTLVSNYQDDRTNGLGFMRLLRFDPLTHSIEVVSYSPWFDQYGYSKASDEENRFTLPNAW